MEKGLHLSFAFDAPQSTATLKTQQRASKYNGKLTTDPNPEVKRGEALAYYIRERFASNPKQAYKLLLDAYRLHMHYETYSAENSRLVGIIVTLEDLFFSRRDSERWERHCKRKDIIYHEEQTITCDGCGRKERYYWAHEYKAMRLDELASIGSKSFWIYCPSCQESLQYDDIDY
jgi:hypothetical protein